jgi:TRAP-type mannitol/chloroaromatic compound transport system permease small subunit
LKQLLTNFSTSIDVINETIGNTLAWCTIACVITCFLVVILRYVFAVGFPWMQELYVWFHAITFMGGAGFVLLHSGHVNVDILYGKLCNQRKAWVDIFGTIVFLLPWMIVLMMTSFDFIIASWKISEPSSQTNGMPALYLLKSLIAFFCVVTLLQGLSTIAKRTLIILEFREAKKGQNNG